MSWKEFFDSNRGKGFLATANAKGEPNIAVYGAPRVQEDGTFVFGMADRLTHANVAENGTAVYAFNTAGFEGYRFYLEKVKEETEGEILEEIKDRARKYSVPGAAEALKFAVHFKLLKHLPLVGS